MAASRGYHVTTEELFILSQRLCRYDINRLGELLGYESLTDATVMSKSTEEEAAFKLLKKFRDEQPIGVDIRGLLAKIITFDFPEESRKLTNRSLIDDEREAMDDEQNEGLNEDTLARLADDIETDTHLENLGRSLGFSHSEMNRYLATNRITGRVTTRGTYDMLCDWKQKVVPRDQQMILKRSLKEANMVFLGERYLRTTVLKEDIENMPIVDNFTIGTCQQRLSDIYKRGICKVQIKPWDKTSVSDVKDVYTVVTMYKKDTSGKNIGEQEKVTLEGSVDDVFRTKVNGMLPKRIVIYAGAGKGKTTAVAKLAYDWAYRVQGSSFETLPLLFILKLRNIEPEVSLGEAIISELLVDVNNLTAERLEAFIRDHQEICWVILDGLDEYSGVFPPDKRTSQSNIVALLENRGFTEVRLLVTSRPHLESEFQHADLSQVYAKMVIEGFSALHVKQYIFNFFADDISKVQSLNKYLQENEIINELVSTPLLCLMVCCLWKEDCVSGINTHTRLFDTIIKFLWHHAKRKSPLLTESWLQEAMKHLGKVALTGLLKDSKKLLFVEDDFKSPEALNDGIDLGLISESVSSGAINPLALPSTVKRTFEFFHQSAQEYAAGRYIASLYSETSWVMRKLDLSKLNMVLKQKRRCIGEYENLLRFIAGTNTDMLVIIMNEILSNASLDESERFRIILDLSTESHEVGGNVSTLITQHIPRKFVVLKSPTLYTIAGMKTLPHAVKQTIPAIKIETPRLTAHLPGKLADGIQSFPNLQEVTILEPTVVDLLPHLTNVPNLKFLGIPSSCDDWNWMRYADGLVKIEVSSGDAELSGVQERLFIDENEAKVTAIRSVLLIKVLENLPSHMKNKVRSVEIEQPRLSTSVQLRLGSCIKFLPNIQDVTIISPLAIEPFLTFSSMRVLTVLSLPPGCGGWPKLWLARNLDEIVVTTLPSSSQQGEGIHIKDNHAEATSNQSPLFNEILESLPLRMKDNIQHVEMNNSKLTLDLANGFANALQSLTNLQEVIILNPTTADSLPHIRHVRSLKLLGLPSTSDDWTWMRVGSGLEKIEVSSKDAEPAGVEELLHVDREKIRMIAIRSVLLIRVLENLPPLMLNRVKSVELKEPQLTPRLQERLNRCMSLLPSVHDVTIDTPTTTDTLPRFLSVRCLKLLEFPPDYNEWDWLGSLRQLEEILVTTSSPDRAWDQGDRIHVKEYGAEATSKHSALLNNVLTALPPHMRVEITSVELKESQVTSEMSRGLQTLSNIESLTIAAPTVVECLPLLTHIRNFHLLGLPADCCDKEWPRLPHNLKELLVTVATGDLQEDGERVFVHHNSVSLVRAHSRMAIAILDALPSQLQNKIHTIAVDDTTVDQAQSQNLWYCLDSFSSLAHLELNNSSLPLPFISRRLPSVRDLKTARITYETYSGVLKSLSNLEYIAMSLNDVDRDIREIASGLDGSGGRRLTHMELYGLGARNCVASASNVTKLGEVIHRMLSTAKLQWIKLCYVDIDGESLIKFIESCRAVPTMQNITLWRCGTRADGVVHSFLKHIQSPRGSVQITMDNGKRYNVPISETAAVIFRSASHRAIHSSFIIVEKK